MQYKNDIYRKQKILKCQSGITIASYFLSCLLSFKLLASSHYDDDDSVSEEIGGKRNYDYDLTGSGFKYEHEYDDSEYYREDYNRLVLAEYGESGEDFDAYVYYDRKYILLPQHGEDSKESKFMHNYML